MYFTISDLMFKQDTDDELDGVADAQDVEEL